MAYVDNNPSNIDSGSGKSQSRDSNNIYPEDFFNIPHPTSPWVSIQFRTSFTIGSNGNIETEHWEEITLNPSNLFDSLIIEDSGGIYHVTINLFDKNFAKLENLIMKTIAASRLTNEVSKNLTHKVDDTQFFNFVISNTMNANLRIRFGYSIWEDDKYIDAVNFTDSDYKDRIDSKCKYPVIRSPWIYLQIMGLKTTFTETGFKASLNCYSTTGAFLDRAKIIQQHAKLVGTPKDVLEQLGKKIAEASNNAIIVKFEGEDPLPVKSEDGSEEIELLLGTEPVFREVNGQMEAVPQFRTIRRLLDLACSKVQIKQFNKKGIVVSRTDGEGDDGTDIEVESYANYGYSVIQNDKVSEIIFKYLNPIDIQKKTRVYSWLNSGTSIVQAFDVQSSIDFAQLNAPISLINDDGQTRTFIGIGNTIDKSSEESKTNFTMGVIRNITEGLKDAEGRFVLDVLNASGKEETGSSTKDAKTYMMKLMSNLNKGVFKGTLTIPGDPFYLFDGVMSPYIYTIKILVRRPDYYDENGINIDGGLSYLSGDYIVGKITHNIGINGFTTNLEVAKYPTTK